MKLRFTIKVYWIGNILLLHEYYLSLVWNNFIGYNKEEK